jgi:hypothetical protein
VPRRLRNRQLTVVQPVSHRPDGRSESRVQVHFAVGSWA